MTLAVDSLFVSAERFITQLHIESHAGPPDRRLWQIRREIDRTGTYWHTPTELAFGARVAWRNSSRCIGRLYWQSLHVRDRREITSAAEVAAESVEHLRQATNCGRIRPVITVFAPDSPTRPGPRILSAQLIRYACYQTADGTFLGDPANADLTRLILDAGWPGHRPASRFDVLPLVVQEPGARATLHELPSDAVLEVRLTHPEFGWFADLGLRWYAVPVISDMYLEIGGVCYPAAPFNGWYMCTEIGSRDLGDTGRYDQLPVIARHMGLATACDRTLWKDKAMTELNVAVLHSFSAAGVTIADHHTESVRFLAHLDREERQGRACPADWTWIVPPAAASATPVFHRSYRDFHQLPNFCRRPSRPDGDFPDLSGEHPRSARRCSLKETFGERSLVTTCITCGSELHPERAKKYDYCMAQECQEKNLKGLTMVAIGVNKSADAYLLLDEQTRDQLASGTFHDQRRGSFGTSLAAPVATDPTSAVATDVASAGASAKAASAAGRTNAARPGRRQRSPQRRPRSTSTERLAVLYNEQGLRPEEIARKLGLSSYAVTQIILASRNRGKL